MSSSFLVGTQFVTRLEELISSPDRIAKGINPALGGRTAS